MTTMRYTPAMRHTTVSSANSSRAKANPSIIPRMQHTLGTSLASMGLLASLTTGSAYANEGPSKVTEFAASGFIFKDSVEVVSFPDPDGAVVHVLWRVATAHNTFSTVNNVTIYISDFKRSITDKLAKDFFSEPSQASVTCVATGPVSIKNPEKVKASGGQEIFSEGKGLNLFQQKTLRVRRIYHDNTLLYVSYSTRLSSTADDGVSSGRYKTSICALPVAPAVVAAAAETVAPPEAVVAQ